jgi:hypothetical protein
MAAYATVEELEVRWRPLSDSEKARATMLLDEVAAIIDTRVAKEPYPPDTTEALWLANAMRVSLTAVERSMETPAGYEGVSTMQQTAGSFSGSLTFANPTSRIYLTRAELSDLGVSEEGTVIFCISPKFGGDEQ